jgi:hypothetical protein
VRDRRPILRQLAVNTQGAEEKRDEMRRGERGDAALHHERDGHRQDQQERRLQPDRERVPEDDGVPREHDGRT